MAQEAGTTFHKVNGEKSQSEENIPGVAWADGLQPNRCFNKGKLPQKGGEARKQHMVDVMRAGGVEYRTFVFETSIGSARPTAKQERLRKWFEPGSLMTDKEYEAVRKAMLEYYENEEDVPPRWVIVGAHRAFI
jgi:hypothetical protein